MKLTKNEINDLIDFWHDDKSILCELWEFLGWSKSDYTQWVKSPGFSPESSMDREEIDFILSKKVSAS
jgi:hypothetical protein